MATLHNTIERAASAGTTATVSIELLWDSTVQAAAFNTVEERTINGATNTATDLTGYWEFDDVDLNANVSPTENVYMVTESIDDTVTTDDIVYYVTVVSSGDNWIGDVTVTKPIWIED